MTETALSAPADLASVCVFCASAEGVDPAFLDGAERLGEALAREGVRLVYGGGGVGLMGACARAAHGAGGRVLGVMPTFLRNREMAFDAVETVFVTSMHERKALMFQQSDAFAVLPGGVGTLEEVVELLSWRRLSLHAKPIVFLNTHDYWSPLFELFDRTIDQGLTPAWFRDTFTWVQSADQILPAIRSMLRDHHGVDADASSLT